jgi:hypothetical protein
MKLICQRRAKKKIRKEMVAKTIPYVQAKAGIPYPAVLVATIKA